MLGAPGTEGSGSLMIEWRDEGALLAVRRHGEGNAIVEVFTEGHGRHLGVVRGGGGRKRLGGAGRHIAARSMASYSGGPAGRGLVSAR